MSDETTVCPICQCPIADDEDRVACAGCDTRYHPECWEMNAGCAVYGCEEVPPTEKRNELEIPVSYWGQENKACPSCGQEILASAKRCRHCGAMFSGAKPETTEEFRNAQQTERDQPALKKGVIWMFVLNAITCTAPLAACIGLAWYFPKRKEIKKLPALYTALSIIGLGLGLLQTILIIVMSLLHSVFR